MTNSEAINWIINISADIGKAEHRDLWHYEQALSEIREMLELEQPERKKGKWILTEDDNYEYCTCSECGYQNGENWMNGSDIPFCAVCGADMRGEDNE